MFRNLLLTGVIFAVLLTGAAEAQVAGTWATTGLTRIDVTAIKAPGLVPERTVDIADGSYQFDNNGNFAAGDITGSWRQKKSQYDITVDRLALENLYRQSLEQTPGLIVNQVKLVKSKLTGNELDNGIWGTESYEYRVDTTLDGRREVLRVVLTVSVAGNPKQETPVTAQGVKALAAESYHSVMDTAVSAVVNYLNHH